jgi:hypothetical protein
VVKLNSEKVEVITTVSQLESDPSTNLSAMSDKFDRAFSNQNSLVSSMITHLENLRVKVVVLIFRIISLN